MSIHVRTTARLRALGGASAAALILVGAVGARAQDANSTGAATVGEVVVTAQKRSEKLQNVPVSVAVVSATRLEQQHITSIQDLTLVSPSVSFNDSNNTRGQGLSIRGVGTLSFSDGVEPSVSTVLDGVVQGRQTSAGFDLIDIDHIEILRGPQGTLFGKNSSAGVINIVTQRPSDTFGGAYSLSYGELGETKAQTTVTGPIVQGKVDGRLTAYYDSNNGYIHDVTTGTDLNAQQQYGVRGKLLFTPTDSLDVLAIADYAMTTGNCCAPTIRSVTANSLYYGKPYASYVGVTPSSTNEDTSADLNSVNSQSTAGISVEADQRIGGFTLTSISAYRHYNEYDNIDSDLIPLDILDLNNANQHQDQASQELRITSPTGHKIEFVAGLFYFYQDLTTTTQTAGTLGATPPGEYLGSQVNRGITTQNWAAFGQATWHVTDALSVIGGLRYTVEDQKAFFDRFELPGAIASMPISVAGPPLTANDLKSDENKSSTHLAVQYQFTPDLMAYVSYSRGFKGAALNLLNFLTAAQVSSGGYLVAPEIPTDYEAGVRATFLNRRLQINATVFDETFKGFQATAYNAISMSNTLVNAGELDSRGFELETIATPARGLTLTGNLAYTDAYFTNFADAPCYPGQLAIPGAGCHALGAADVQNLKGQPLNNAPKWSLTLGASYIHSLGWHDLDGFADVNYAYRSAVNYSLDEDPNTVQNGYGVTSLNLGVQFPTHHLRLGLFARNLFDVRYASYIYPSSFQAGNASTPAGYSQFFPEDSRRIVGVALSGKF